MNHGVLDIVRASNYAGVELRPLVSDAILPSGTHCVELHSGAGNLERYLQLDDAEQELVAQGVDKRKADFGDSRWCAHQALKGLRMDGPIMRGLRGMPTFPEGTVGSLTHTEGFRAAVVGRSTRWKSLGIDAEPAAPLPDGVFEAIARPEEHHRMRTLDIPFADKVLFSAKETTYKTWFPLTHRFLDFDQADIDLRPDGTFTSYLLTRPVPVPFIQGKWAVEGGYVITIAGVRH